jgi:hypothetical protein
MGLSVVNFTSTGITFPASEVIDSESGFTKVIGSNITSLVSFLQPEMKYTNEQAITTATKNFFSMN